MTCSALYCHSDGTSVSTTVVPAFISPPWTFQGPLACTSCHGYPPAYTHDNPKSNLHGKHHVSCNYCHYATTNDGIHITDTTKHINGQYDVNANSAIGSEITYTWDRGGGTCSNVSCHGVLHHNTIKTWNDEIENIDISYTPNTSGFHLGVEFKFWVVPGYLCSLRFPGVSYLWDFGDGGTSTDPEPTHIYTTPGTYPISVKMRDADYHPASAGGRFIQIATPANVPPVSAMSVSVSGSTITVTDLSYDPDYNLYENSGPGKITILWGDFTKTVEPINLTGSPSNQVYIHTSSKDNYNLKMLHVVRDNHSSTPAVMPTEIGFRTPVLADSISISGRLTRSGAASSLQGQLVLKKNNVLVSGYFSKPNSQGDYQITGIPAGCYTVEPVPVTGYTFNPVKSVSICTSTTGVDFTVQ
jgi:predicted CxxxxCH...CXXCH cytochrome family protein